MDTSIEAPASRSEDRLVYSVAKVAELLGISRAFAYELVARGELPVIRLGRRRLVPKVALVALLETDTLGVPATSADVNLPLNPPLSDCAHSVVDVHADVHKNVHIPAQGTAAAPRSGPDTSRTRAVQAGEAEALDMSGAGP
jgi:excisionase family DNA binding protein